MTNMPPSSGTAQICLELIYRATRALDETALEFIVVNDTYLLAPYRQSALWDSEKGVVRLSGVTSIELNSPYVLWLKLCFRRLESLEATAPRAIAPEERENLLGADWSEWAPDYVLWIPIRSRTPNDLRCGLLLARETPWTAFELGALQDWLSTWTTLRHYAQLRRTSPPLLRAARRWFRSSNKRIALAALILALTSIIPVNITVLVPAELVPADPMPVRAPLDGVLSEMLVKPNQSVRAGDPLFSIDALQLISRLDVARQSLATAEAELRQIEQQSMVDPKARAGVAAGRGNVAERRAEMNLLIQQKGRATVVAMSDGFAMYDDPSQWTGRPVSTGERIMRIASPADVEIEAWIPSADAIPLLPEAQIRMYLTASPLEPVGATLRYLSHEAIRRPEGVYAYRLRARLDGPTRHRIGLRGTARISGERVSFLYWVLRRPLGAVREFLGL